MSDRHGWHLFGRPLLCDQLERLADATNRAKQADPPNWRQNTNVKIRAALTDLILDRIPSDPFSPAYRQGNTLGPAHRHWFRAKFGGNRLRLFFRADAASRTIVYAWVNDRDTLRKSGSANDPYALFAAMLARGNPPTDWPSLLAAAQQATATQRFTAIAAKPDETG